jgi:Tol biopolymer transport system component
MHAQRLLIFLTMLLPLALLSVLPAAGADHPGNGQITFGRFDPQLGDFSIWAANPDGTHQRRLTDEPSFFSDWSPDGRRIAFDFVDDTGVHIATMDPDGRRVRQLTFGEGIQEVPKWSPDGRWITFDASPEFPDAPGFHTDVWVMRADGSHARQLTKDHFDVEPVFSADGRRIAFGRITDDEVGEEAIYVINRDGTAPREVVAPTLGLEHPDWSPDGRWITFNIAPEAPRAAVMAVRPDGRDLRVVRPSTGRFKLFKPVWSPDGSRFLVGCFDTKAQIEGICTMRADGGHLGVVVGGQHPVNFPAWGSHPPIR